MLKLTFTSLFISLLLIITAAVWTVQATELPQRWYYLGPFLYGKTEYDGDPLSAFGGLDDLLDRHLRQKQSKSSSSAQQKPEPVRVPSESAANGFVQWREIPMHFPNPKSRSVGDIQVEHRELVELQQQLSGDSAALEFVGYVVADVAVTSSSSSSASAPRYLTFQCSGIHTIYVDGNPVMADQFGRTFYSTIATAAKSTTTTVRIAARIRGKAQAQFRLRIVPNPPRLTVHRHPWAADLVCDDENSGAVSSCNFFLRDGHTAFSVVLQSHRGESFPSIVPALDPATATSAFLKIINADEDMPPPLCDDWVRENEDDEAKELLGCGHNHRHSRLTSLDAMSTRTLSFPVTVTDEKLAADACRSSGKQSEITVNVNLLDGSATVIEKVSFRVRCRNLLRETFFVAYRDFDGSPGQAGVVLPLERLNKTTATAATTTTATFPILLSLHGSGVAPTSQVDAYKVGDAAGNFVFGVRGMFVITPSKHGAHNHEFVGKKANLFAALLIAAVTSQQSKHRFVADARRILFAGASMGAHGALTLAVHNPSRSLGLMLLAGWTTKEKYGDANAIFHLDRSTDSVGFGGQRKSVIEASVNDYNVLAQLENLLHVPVYARTGAVDNTVSPYFARRFVRMLRELGHENVTYEEPRTTKDGPAGHWWWSTRTANDGGCVNDKSVRRFIARVVKNSNNNQNNNNNQNRELPLSATARRRIVGSCDLKQQQQLARVFVSHSVHATKFHHNVTLLEQHVPMMRSEINLLMMSSAEDDVTVRARNVKRAVVNGVEFCSSSGKNNNNHKLEKCLDQGQQKDSSSSSSSPIRQYMERPFTVVACVPSSEQTAHHHSHAVFNFARYIADIALVAYETDAPVVVARTVDDLTTLLTTSSTTTSRAPVILASLEENAEMFNAIVNNNAVSSSTSLVSIDSEKIVLRSSSSTTNEQQLKIVRGTDLVFMSVFRGGGLLILGQTTRALRHAVVDIGTPTVPPMMRGLFGNLLPDWFVSDSSKSHLGYGSFMAGGFYSNDRRTATVTPNAVMSFWDGAEDSSDDDVPSANIMNPDL